MPLPSNRSFGLLFAGLFGLIAVVPLLHSHTIHWWSLVLAVIFFGAACWFPDRLAPLNRAWMRFATILHHIVSPLVLGVIFFMMITPAALVMRMFGRDALRLRPDRAATSFWIRRAPPGPDARQSLPRQF